MKKVIPVSRLSRAEDKPGNNDPVPGLLGTMAGGAAVCALLLCVFPGRVAILIFIA